MEVLKLYIHVNGCEKVESECATVQMISFDGRCDGDYFRGEILPGGVDTQIYYKDQPSKLSGDQYERVKAGKRRRIPGNLFLFPFYDTGTAGKDGEGSCKGGTQTATSGGIPYAGAGSSDFVGKFCECAGELLS